MLLTPPCCPKHSPHSPSTAPSPLSPSIAAHAYHPAHRLHRHSPPNDCRFLPPPPTIDASAPRSRFLAAPAFPARRSPNCCTHLLSPSTRRSHVAQICCSHIPPSPNSLCSDSKGDQCVAGLPVAEMSPSGGLLVWGSGCGARSAIVKGEVPQRWSLRAFRARAPYAGATSTEPSSGDPAADARGCPLGAHGARPQGGFAGHTQVGPISRPPQDGADRAFTRACRRSVRATARTIGRAAATYFQCACAEQADLPKMAGGADLPAEHQLGKANPTIRLESFHKSPRACHAR